MELTLRDLGSVVKAYREPKLTQDQLVKECKELPNRSVISHLEQGLRVPDPMVLHAICEFLAIPRFLWERYTDPDFAQVVQFEHTLTELIGRVVNLRHLDETSRKVAEESVLRFLRSDLTNDQALSQLNSLLINYDVRPPMSVEFFNRFFKDKLHGLPKIADAVREYQSIAIRLFNSLSNAYYILNTAESLSQVLLPLRSREVTQYLQRKDWNEIEVMDEDELAWLGYISSGTIRQERDIRVETSNFLKKLARNLSENKPVFDGVAEKEKRKMDSHLRELNSSLAHGLLSPLFAQDPDALRREAELIAPKEENDLAKIERCHEAGLRNLARYLAADYLDVYVATSMRSPADFVSVNRFVTKLFRHDLLSEMKLRFFNPTQSWIGDRVAKGLVEALMLRRADFTIYIAQKEDSFGKDSEASVALGQGKPVLVYVPKLVVPEIDLDSEVMGRKNKGELITSLQQEGSEIDDSLDEQALFSKTLECQLGPMSDSAFINCIRSHWADFALYGEAHRVKATPSTEESYNKHEELNRDKQARYRGWLDSVIKEQKDIPIDPDLRDDVIGILVANAVNFEKRSATFRKYHPLALQVILSSGVLNGMIVVRSIESCAQILKALMKNELELVLHSDENSYRLVEKNTESTIRVISRHSLVTSAFSTFYAQQAVNDTLTVTGVVGKI